MTKLNFEVVVSGTPASSNYMCRTTCDGTASVLGLLRDATVPMAQVLADSHELKCLREAIQNMLSHDTGSFETLNLVFNAVDVPPTQERAPLDDVFVNPLQAIHICEDLQVACFTHLELVDQKPSSSDVAAPVVIRVTALEYSRSHRKSLLRQEFSSWLLEEHIEKSVVATDMNGVVCFWNRFAGELYQYTAHEAIGRSVFELFTSELTIEDAQVGMEKLFRGEHYQSMFPVKRKDDSVVMAHVTNTPILDVNEKLKFIVGVSADYTHLHSVMNRLEELNSNLEREVQARTHELLERERLLRRVGAAVQESDTAVLITNKEFAVIWANNAVYKMLSLPEDGVMGKLPWSLPLVLENKTLPSTENHDSLQNFFQSVMANAPSSLAHDSTAATATATVSTHLDRVVGAAKQVTEVVSTSIRKLTPSTILNEDEAIKEEYMITLRDITADRVAEEALLLAEKSSATSRTKTEMMRILSHELRTPLQGIMGCASTMLVDLDAEHRATMFDSLSVILASSRLLLTLINNVLDSGKIDSDMMKTVELSPVPVMAAIRDSIRFCGPFAALNDTKVVFIESDADELSGRHILSDVYVLGNRMRIEQILVNLTSNSIKYTTPGTPIEISCRFCSREQAMHEVLSAAKSDLSLLPKENAELLYDTTQGGVIIVSVRDYGPGIPPNEFGKVFGEFSQLSVSDEKDRKYSGGSGGQSCGSGLGLNLALKFVTMMDGHIWFNNCETGGGVTFNFSIPRFKDPVDIPREEDEVGEDDEMGAEIAERFRILIVDDSAINLKVLARMLQRIGVKQIETAANGLIAHNYMLDTRHQLPNLLLVDLQMPVMDGFELMENLSKATLIENPLVVACSADWAPETEERCTKVGFDGLLRKPITLPDVKRFLNRIANEQPERFSERLELKS